MYNPNPLTSSRCQLLGTNAQALVITGLVWELFARVNRHKEDEA